MKNTTPGTSAHASGAILTALAAKANRTHRHAYSTGRDYWIAVCHNHPSRVLINGGEHFASEAAARAAIDTHDRTRHDGVALTIPHINAATFAAEAVAQATRAANALRLGAAQASIGNLEAAERAVADALRLARVAAESDRATRANRIPTERAQQARA